MSLRRIAKRPLPPLLAGMLLAAALVTGCGDGGGSGSNVAATDATTTIGGSGPTVAALRPIGNTDAGGTARYVKKPDGSRLIVLRVHGLEPASGNRQYVVWQKHSRHDMALLATWHVGANGQLVKTWEPNSPSLRFLEEGLKTKLLITRIADSSSLFEVGASDTLYDFNFIGRPVLEGEFSGALVGATADE